MLSDTQCLNGVVATLSRLWFCQVAAGAYMAKRVSLVDKKEEDTWWKILKNTRKKAEIKKSTAIKKGRLKKHM